jgi:hypothetical protein
MRGEQRFVWGARASRVLAKASGVRELFSVRVSCAACNEFEWKACFGAMPKPTRGTRVLPGIASRLPLV